MIWILYASQVGMLIIRGETYTWRFTVLNPLPHSINRNENGLTPSSLRQRFIAPSYIMIQGSDAKVTVSPRQAPRETHPNQLFSLVFVQIDFWWQGTRQDKMRWGFNHCNWDLILTYSHLLRAFVMEWAINQTYTNTFPMQEGKFLVNPQGTVQNWPWVTKKQSQTSVFLVASCSGPKHLSQLQRPAS